MLGSSLVLGASGPVLWSHASASSEAPEDRAVEGARVRAAAGLSHSRVVPWPIPTVWPTAVRYLRVDRGYTIVDRDPEAGFILFEFPVESPSCGSCETRKASGSLELFATTDASGRPSSHLEVTTEGGATHLPYAIVDGLQAKLRDERGNPPPPPPKKDPPKDPDRPKPPSDGDAPKQPPKGKAPKAPAEPDDGSPPQMPLDR